VRPSLPVYPAVADWVAGVYDWDAETGLISNRQPFFDNNARGPAALADPVSTALGLGNPDRHTLDIVGRVYQAVFARACIERFAPDGTHDLTIGAPRALPDVRRVRQRRAHEPVRDDGEQGATPRRGRRGRPSCTRLRTRSCS
jgi:hypothetical protein